MILGAIACVLALIFLICAIWIAYETMREEEEDDYSDPYVTELRFTSQGRVLRIDRYDENEV